MSSVEEAERLSFVQASDLPGVQLMVAQETPRVWRIVNAGFAYAALDTWQGHVDYRQRRWPAGAGDLFCGGIGELHCATPRTSRGSFGVINILPETFSAFCRAEGLRGKPHFAASVVTPSARLRGALARMRAAIIREASLLERHAALAALVNASMTEVLEATSGSSPSLRGCDAVARLREVLHSNEGSRLNLLRFAEREGVSLFQLLRGFKRRYGLPPHAYELHMRVERARQMLHLGYTVAEVAAAHDFVDQSHFTRHFRRMWGMTPGSYARSGARRLQVSR
jgi:AraC-like DNA-binding protein